MGSFHFTCSFPKSWATRKSFSLATSFSAASLEMRLSSIFRGYRRGVVGRLTLSNSAASSRALDLICFNSSLDISGAFFGKMSGTGLRQVGEVFSWAAFPFLSCSFFLFTVLNSPSSFSSPTFGLSEGMFSSLCKNPVILRQKSLCLQPFQEGNPL